MYDEKWERKMQMKFGVRKDFFYFLIIDTRQDPPLEIFYEKRNAYVQPLDAVYFQNAGVKNWTSFRGWFVQQHFTKAKISSSFLYQEKDANHYLYRVVITQSGGVDIDMLKWERVRGSF